MRYLLDTHIVIWAMVGSKKLSDKAASTLRNPENELYVSPISILEVAIKHAIRPEEIPVTAEQMVRFFRSIFPSFRKTTAIFRSFFME